MVKITTNLGSFEISLDAKKAPISVENFIEYIENGHYNGTIFHRVIDGFMIQGGGFDKDFNQKPTRAPIKNESSNGLQNKAMTISMARLPDPDSATAQFFINLIDNSNLDGSASQPGYAVFGKVTKGQDIVEKIGKLPTTSKLYYDDVPVEPVIIEKVEVLL
ncbi:MAG: cyclophilin [Deltaproteobacteria bacterium CG11_big_fil_rev_8_21_14_0_20_45_16]|nr:MAG: cyclophilin [Deltaproteobacteria bacterium CG11_big_fil_rev_8_21_14_0_20_45_16]